ncbi:uncharacterized protein LOC110720743 [Chenopodium quinoa]|uniref:uncharacterized protein LOC110720743 n=1 Tax=Chenopodium quinoa TaxID=63459 RepID=UPI000B7832B1|nr:uncharacterized protein LOC110720743 [Chenopodium quinoa]
MERLNILAIFLLLTTTLAVPTWGRIEKTKNEKQEILDEVMKMEMGQNFKAIPVVVKEEVVAVVEEPPKTARLRGCAGVGENCVYVSCCPTSSAGNRVICSAGLYNAVCVEIFPPPDWPEMIRRSLRI